MVSVVKPSGHHLGCQDRTIGSAAGVAAMGLEKIEFFWYVKRISGLAMSGYLGGAATYILPYRMLH